MLFVAAHPCSLPSLLGPHLARIVTKGMTSNATKVGVARVAPHRRSNYLLAQWKFADAMGLIMCHTNVKIYFANDYRVRIPEGEVLIERCLSLLRIPYQSSRFLRTANQMHDE